MKTLKLSSVSAIVILMAIIMNSCGTTNFQGYYPDNRISGTGIGSTEAPQAVVTEANETEATVAENRTPDVIDAVASASESTEAVALATAEAPKRKGEKIEKFAFNMLAKSRWGKAMLNKEATMEERMEIMTEKSLSGAVMRKISERVVKKRFGSNTAGMPLEDIFAIVSISAGGAAWLWYAGFFFGPAAIAFGIVALVKGTSRRGMAIAGICLGAIALFFWILFIAIIWGGATRAIF